MSKKWIKYWSKKNIWGSSHIWKKNSFTLYNNIKKYLSVNDKNILDLGCGTGELIEYLSIDAKSVCGVDVSDIYIKICKKKFLKNKKVIIKKFKNNYNNIYKMNRKFSIIFCNSVVQYFSNEDEIIKLVKSVKKVSEKNTKFIISDIMVKNQKKNLVKLLFYSIFRGYFLTLINQYFILVLNSKYRKLEVEYNLLEIDINKLIKKIKPLTKKIKIIDYPLTINTNRKHLLIEF